MSCASTVLEQELQRVECTIKDAVVCFAQSVTTLCEEKDKTGWNIQVKEAQEKLFRYFSNDNSFEEIVVRVFAQASASNSVGCIGHGTTFISKHQHHELYTEDAPTQTNHDPFEIDHDQILTRFPSGSDTDDVEHDIGNLNLTLQEQERTSLLSLSLDEAVQRPMFAIQRKQSSSTTSGTPSETLESATNIMAAAVKAICHKRHVKLGRRSTVDVEHLTHVAISIGSPTATVQLFDALQAAAQRPGSDTTVAFHDMDFVTLVHEVETDDDKDHTTNIIRRFQLHRMASFGHERKAFRLHEWQAKQMNTVEGQDMGSYSGRLDSRIQTKIACSAMKDVMREAYPTLEHDRTRRSKEQQTEYAKRWNALRDLLFRAERWYWLAERYTRGILPLIPTAGPMGVSNGAVEFLTPAAFGILLAALQETRGGYLTRLGSKLHSNVVDLLTGACVPMFVFKNMERRHLEHASYDSKVLVTYCGSIIPSSALQRRESTYCDN